MKNNKKILLASPRGYCAGVDRAVNTVEKSLEVYGSPIYVRKEIVHNKHVVENLESKGVIFVNEVDEVPMGQTLIFSAHGVSPQVKEEAKKRNLHTIDATCPLVTKVHQESRRYARDDFDILLIGHKGHEEVEGTAGEAPDKVQVVDEDTDIDSLRIRDLNKVVWLSQTTLSVDETEATVDKIKQKIPQLKNPPSVDICYATQNRQNAVKKIAQQSDLLLVVGSKNSSNSQRLVEVALAAGAGASYLIDDAKGIDLKWLENVSAVGLTSGASVPHELVLEVIDFLKDQGFADVEEVFTIEETLTFSLPREIRAAK